MNKIRLLDNNTINKIAAGEVVERPSSVVKELCENSIDAQASAITIEIRDGGTSFIRISDNGKGIEKDFVETAFLRHATSKIEDIADLDNIYSLGFRGEALASIASVSIVEIVTKPHNQETGFKVEISGGNITYSGDYASTEGTSISVKNLFYNVPARRNFLKKATVESSYISDIVNKIALAHPEISIKYINNGNVMLHTSGNNDLRTAVFHVYSKEMSLKMIDINYSQRDFKISGLLGKPEIARGNRSYENLFINGRFVKNETVSQAIEDAYKTRLMGGKFPVFVINLYLNANVVDVNVHPTKLEVRFRDEDAIYDFVYNAVFQVLKDEVLIPQSNLEGKPSPQVMDFIKQDISLKENSVQQVFNNEVLSSENSKVSYTKPSSNFNELKELYKSKVLSDEVNGGKNVLKEKTLSYIPMPEVKQEIMTAENKEEKRELFFNNYKITGQIFSTYWIIEQGSSIFLIDQHAAHERILYEEMYNTFSEEKIVSQRLLQPLMLNLTEYEKELLKENMSIIEKCGFEIENFGNINYAITSMPYIFKNPENLSFFNEILDALDSNSIKNAYDTRLNTVATMACKAAVKANDKLDFQEAVSIIEKLLKLENPFSCPHGRPTIIELTKYEIEKKFKRIV